MKIKKRFHGFSLATVRIMMSDKNKNVLNFRFDLVYALSLDGFPPGFSPCLFYIPHSPLKKKKKTRRKDVVSVIRGLGAG